MAAPRVLPYLVALAAALALHLVLWEASYAEFSRSIDFNEGALEDFKGPYLDAAGRVLEQGRPAPGFLYPPSFALALAPLATVSEALATGIWVSIQVVAAAALVALGLLVARPRKRWLGPLYAFVALTSLPLAHNLHWGQVSTPIAVLVLVAALADRGRRTQLAALALTLAVAIKFYPALFAVVFLVREDWRASATFAAASFLLLVGLPAVLLGGDHTFEFYRAVFSDLGTRQEGLWGGARNSQVLGAVVARWLGVSGEGPGLALFAVGVVWALAHLVLLRRIGRAAPIAFALVALSVPLVVSPSWPHYLVLLPFAQLLIADRADGDRLALGLVGLSALLSNVAFFRAFHTPQSYGAGGWLLIANLLLLASLYRILSVRRPPARSGDRGGD